MNVYLFFVVRATKMNWIEKFFTKWKIERLNEIHTHTHTLPPHLHRVDQIYQLFYTNSHINTNGHSKEERGRKRVRCSVLLPIFVGLSHLNTIHLGVLCLFRLFYPCFFLCFIQRARVRSGYRMFLCINYALFRSSHCTISKVYHFLFYSTTKVFVCIWCMHNKRIEERKQLN